LSPDDTDVAVTGGVSGAATWITAVYDAATGARRWQVTAAEGTTAKDVVVDDTRVYVTGQGVTGAGTPALRYFLTVVAYDRATGARRWRTDKTPADGSYAMGLWMAKAPDGAWSWPARPIVGSSTGTPWPSRPPGRFGGRPFATAD
jgi:hypothetical protein